MFIKSTTMATSSISRSRRYKKASSQVSALTVAAEKVNRVLTLSGASLLSLPHDIERIIFEMLIDHGDLEMKPSISYRKLSNGQRHQEFTLSFPTAYKRLSPLIKVCKQTRSSCYEYLGASVTLIEDRSDRLLYQHCKKYWSKDLLPKIRRLEVKMTTNMKPKHEQDWLVYLKLFVNTMTSLNHFQLTSTWYPASPSWPRALSGESRNSVKHEDQE